MPRRPLAGAFEKVRRAKEHIEALETEVGRLQSFKPYRLVPKTDMTCREGIEIPRSQAKSLEVTKFFPDLTPAHPGNIIVPLIHAEEMGIYLSVTRPRPVLRWASIIGDVTNNLRSALDQLVWELSIDYQRSLPTPCIPFPKSDILPRGSQWRSAKFPVAESPSIWGGQKNSCLWLVDQNLLPKFNDQQPYKRGNRYQRHWLWLLNELWNRDKHRAVAVTAVYGMAQMIDLLPALGEPLSVPQFHEEFDVKLRWVKSIGRFKDGVKLAGLIITRKNPRLPELRVNFDVQTTVRMGIRFKKAPPTYGAEVFETLEGLTANVERVLNGFVSDFK